MTAWLALGALEGFDAYGVAVSVVCHDRAKHLTNTALACLRVEEHVTPDGVETVTTDPVAIG